MINLLDFDRAGLREYCASIGEKPFRADQLLQWIHLYGHATTDHMTNISQVFKQYLSEHTVIESPTIIQCAQSTDGTQKWLLQLQDQHCIETVFIPERDRGTLCVSSQVGCPLRCDFCATGKQGFKRNLTVAEIIGQVWQIARQLSTQNQKHDRSITNIVMMGMGEPLLNFDNVITATNIMMDDLAYGLSKYRVTVSTAGIAPEIDRLSQLSDVSLAVSLHAPNNTLRSSIMPINKRYPLEVLMPACKRFFKPGGKRKIAFEYILLKKINDQPEYAHQLIQLLQSIPCKVNLIPYNTIDDIDKKDDYSSSTDATAETFQRILLNAGIRTMIRKKKGSDIAAACGQLARIVEDD